MKPLAKFAVLAALAVLPCLLTAGDDSPTLAPRAFTLDKATVPETAAFHYMRSVSGGSLMSLDDLHTQIAHYRSMSQDHKRRGLQAADWIEPAEFRRHRALYVDMLKEAQVILHPAATRPGTGTGTGSVSPPWAAGQAAAPWPIRPRRKRPTPTRRRSSARRRSRGRTR